MSFFAELKRRNVIRVGAAYVALSWLFIQVVETLFPIFGLSDQAMRAVVIILFVGFVPAVVAAWAFEWTPEGLKRDGEVEAASQIGRHMAKRLDRVIMVVLALALGYFVVDKFALAPQREAEEQDVRAEQLAAATKEARRAGRSEAIVESYGDKSIAVMPFADMSPDGDQRFFSDGISEELLNLLARFDDLRVISRSSSFAMSEEGLSAPEIAQRLNVSYVLEGSVRRSGDTVRITAQLVDARSDTHLWSETYDRTVHDVFAVQDEISAHVVDELQVRLLGAAPKSGTTEPAAYELYLRGLSELASHDDIERAVTIFEQVIDIDPDYAPAYGSMAVALVWSDLKPSIRDPRLEAAASRALKLDPGNSDALTALGRMRSENLDYTNARKLLEQAIVRNANNALAHRWLGLTYSDSDPTRYRTLIRKAYELNPLDPSIHYHLARAAFFLGRWDEALEAARALEPPTRYMVAADVHHHAGRLDYALKTYYLAYRTSGSFGLVMRELMSMKAYELVDAWIAESRKTAPAGLNPAERNLAALRGDPGSAFRMVAAAARERGDATSDWEVAWAHVRYTGDFLAAREIYERFLFRGAPGESTLRFNPDIWIPFIDYALTLQRTGASDRAAELTGEIADFLEARIATGGVMDRQDLNLQYQLSAVHAIRGDTRQAIKALRNAAAQGGLYCTHCVRAWPHWESVRGEPEFDAVVTGQESEHAAQRQRLADEGMLLGPAEVLELDGLSFDPFEP
jgi:TolB-like protein